MEVKKDLQDLQDFYTYIRATHLSYRAKKGASPEMVKNSLKWGKNQQ